MSWNTYEEILADIMADKPKAPPPKPTPTQKVEERFAASNQPTVAVIDAATAHNNALTERLDETMEDRRKRQIAKELAEHSAESPLWRALVHWTHSVERAQERVRALDGEVPEKGIYSPIARFEREMRGR